MSVCLPLMVADLVKTDVPSAPPGIQKSSALGPSSPASPFTEDDFENHVCIPLSHHGEVEAMLYFREAVFRLDPIRLHESQGKFHLKNKNASLAVWLQNPPLVSLAQFPRFFALSFPHVHNFSFCSSCNSSYVNIWFSCIDTMWLFMHYLDSCSR